MNKSTANRLSERFDEAMEFKFHTTITTKSGASYSGYCVSQGNTFIEFKTKDNIFIIKDDSMETIVFKDNLEYLESLAK